MFGLAPEAAFTPTLASRRVEHWRQFDRHGAARDEEDPAIREA